MLRLASKATAWLVGRTFPTWNALKNRREYFGYLIVNADSTWDELSSRPGIDGQNHV